MAKVSEMGCHWDSKRGGTWEKKLEKEVNSKKVTKNKGYKVYRHAGWNRKVALGTVEA